jgi:hypothetical protein
MIKPKKKTVAKGKKMVYRVIMENVGNHRKAE